LAAIDARLARPLRPVWALRSENVILAILALAGVGGFCFVGVEADRLQLQVPRIPGGPTVGGQRRMVRAPTATVVKAATSHRVVGRHNGATMSKCAGG